MSPVAMLGTSSIIFSILTLVISSPTNNIHIALDIFLNPSTIQTSGQATCTAEGFYPSPTDCTRFYRCVDFDGTFTKFDFQCGPGTMYHPEMITCVHPWLMPRDAECSKDHTKHAALEVTRDAKKRKQVPLATSDKAKGKDFECTADGIFADPGDCVTYHECTEQSDGSFSDDVEVCEDEEMFCQPVGGCGPSAGCPVACAEGRLDIQDLK